MAIYKIDPEAAAEIASITANKILYGTVESADRWLSKLGGKLSILARNPRMGRVRSDIDPYSHMFNLDRDYNIFYDITDYGIDVLHIRRPK